MKAVFSHRITEREVHVFCTRHKMEFDSARREQMSAINVRHKVTTRRKQKKKRNFSLFIVLFLDIAE